MAFFSQKNNVMINFLHKYVHSSSLSKRRQYFHLLFRFKYFKNHNISPCISVCTIIKLTIWIRASNWIFFQRLLHIPTQQRWGMARGMGLRISYLPTFRSKTRSGAVQGCQMVYFHTKNPKFGLILEIPKMKILAYLIVIWSLGIRCVHLLYFTPLWYIVPRKIREEIVARRKQNFELLTYLHPFLSCPRSVVLCYRLRDWSLWDLRSNPAGV
jgi:hypothetical protein